MEAPIDLSEGAEPCCNMLLRPAKRLSPLPRSPPKAELEPAARDEGAGPEGAKEPRGPDGGKDEDGEEGCEADGPNDSPDACKAFRRSGWMPVVSIGRGAGGPPVLGCSWCEATRPGRLAGPIGGWRSSGGLLSGGATVCESELGATLPPRPAMLLLGPDGISGGLS